METDDELLWQAVLRLRPTAQEIIYLPYFLGPSEVETPVLLSITDLGEPISLTEAQETFLVPLLLPREWDESGVVYGH